MFSLFFSLYLLFCLFLGFCLSNPGFPVNGGITTQSDHHPEVLFKKLCKGSTICSKRDPNTVCSKQTDMNSYGFYLDMDLFK